MVVLLWAVGIVLVAALMGFMAYAFAVGGLGILTRSTFERCPRCGHHGLVHGVGVHPGACPVTPAGRAARLVHSAPGWLHPGHH